MKFSQPIFLAATASLTASTAAYSTNEAIQLNFYSNSQCTKYIGESDHAWPYLDADPSFPEDTCFKSPNLLGRPASILLGPIFTAAALQLRHIALCIPGFLAMKGNRQLQFTVNPAMGVCQLDLPRETISGRALDATLARRSKYISSGRGIRYLLWGKLYVHKYRYK